MDVFFGLGAWEVDVLEEAEVTVEVAVRGVVFHEVLFFEEFQLLGDLIEVLVEVDSLEDVDVLLVRFKLLCLLLVQQLKHLHCLLQQLLYLVPFDHLLRIVDNTAANVGHDAHFVALFLAVSVDDAAQPLDIMIHALNQRLNLVINSAPLRAPESAPLQYLLPRVEAHILPLFYFGDRFAGDFVEVGDEGLDFIL